MPYSWKYTVNTPFHFALSLASEAIFRQQFKSLYSKEILFSHTFLMSECGWNKALPPSIFLYSRPTLQCSDWSDYEENGEAAFQAVYCTSQYD